MTCRHKEGDPECTSGNSPDDLRKKATEQYSRRGKTQNTFPSFSSSTYSTPTTPDCEQFDVLDAKEVFGGYLIMKVKYPNCSNCAYEGTKILVFENANLVAALRWKRIDPHFRDATKKSNPNEAPPPIARFPASVGGYEEAIAYAEWRKRKKEDER
jgi:hypothetical protein